MKNTLSAILAGIIVLCSIVPVEAGVLPFDKAEYSARRAKLMAEVSDGIAIIPGTRSGRQNNEIKYFCGVEVPRVVLIVDGIRKESILFYTTSVNYLRGEGLSPELARDPKGTTGVEKYYPARQFSDILTKLVEQTSIIYTPFRSELREPDLSTSDEWDGRLTRQLRFVKLLQERFSQVQIKDCSEIIWEIRRIKTQAEIEFLRQAGRIGVKAMIEVMKAAKPGQYEYELSSLYEYVCKRQGCRELAFDVIISSAENHRYLHYSGHNRLLADGDFLVVDAGPKYQGYDTDTTISFPINGKFTPRQREIYQACLEVSKGCMALYKSGITGYEIGKKVQQMLQKKGYDLNKDAFSSLRFFREGGITHYVGLATHDAGGRDLPPNRPLEPGMVFACDVFAVYADENLGVRVENTILITETGCENLNPGLPREISQIEALMKK